MTALISQQTPGVSLGPIATNFVGFENASGGTTAAVTMPTGLQVGDIIISCFVTATGSCTAPGGFTLGGSNVGTAVQTYMHYHIVTDPASEASTYTYTALTASQRQICFVGAYRGVDTVTPMDATATVGTNTGSGNSCVISAMTTVTPGAMLISAIGGNASAGPPTWTQPSSWTQEGHSSGNGKGSAIADFKQAAAGSTGTETWTWSTTNLEMRGVMIALRPLVRPTKVFDSQVSLERASNW